MFEKELEFFKNNQSELVSKYLGKTLVIKGSSLLGVFNTPLEAYFETLKDHELGTFMLQKVDSGPEAYTVTINSLIYYRS